MNTTHNNNTTAADPTNSRPLDFWVKAADRMMSSAFSEAFRSEGLGRREWRALNVIDGTVSSVRPLTKHKLHRLIDRGWVTLNDSGWALTDSGRTAKERLNESVQSIRHRVAAAVSAEDLEITMRSLEQLTRALGWDEETPLPRPKGRRGRGIGRGRGFGHRYGTGHGSDRESGIGCERDHSRGHGHGHGIHPAVAAAYGRGFVAGATGTAHPDRTR